MWRGFQDRIAAGIGIFGDHHPQSQNLGDRNGYFFDRKKSPRIWRWLDFLGLNAQNFLADISMKSISKPHQIFMIGSTSSSFFVNIYIYIDLNSDFGKVMLLSVISQLRKTQKIFENKGNFWKNS